MAAKLHGWDEERLVGYQWESRWYSSQVETIRYGTVKDDSLTTTSLQNLSELVKPPPTTTVTEEQKAESTTRGLGEVLGITEEEEKELAELMEDDI
jgi:hypothetical protein